MSLSLSLTFLLEAICLLASGQQIQLLSNSSKISFRGLSVVNDRLIWVSGSKGTVGKSIDGGKTWNWITVKGYEKRDFRDIEAFDAKTAVIMAIAEPAEILRTTDGGKTWKQAFYDSAQGMFLDAMDFWNVRTGIVLGDPVNGKFFIARTFDGGVSWHQIPYNELPAADSGEACFAASGTNIRKLDRQSACFVSGGLRSRLFLRDQPMELPIIHGKGTTGANSVAVLENRKLKGGIHLIVVGGDFSRDSSRENNCFLTNDGGKSWIAPSTSPNGYRSCVEYINQTKLICCGTSGVDVSEDSGMNWRLISKLSFHVCQKAKNGKSVFLAGNDGRIARLVW
jgi:photosystem II stability/assembly factor-like uncharacterized protein